jgi:putative flavoprotein involved in K+ transport
MHNEERYQVLIIGAGQAGLAMGWHLQRQGLSFLILEAGDRPGGNWRYYYDSLKLFSPAGYSSLPGLPFFGDPTRYPRRDEVVDYLEEYATRFQLPIRLDTRIQQVSREANGFLLLDQGGHTFSCQALVVASGPFDRPYTPTIAGLNEFQGRLLHSRDYRNPHGLEGQRVVVIGAANSAVQIAHELAEVAQVTLATRVAIRFMPQRLLGQDFHFWLKWTGLDWSRRASDQGTPVLDDGRYRRALREGRFTRRAMFQRVTHDGVVWAGGEHEQVDALLFATGYRPNLTFLAGLPVQDAQGQVLQRDGRALQVPGLYFVGLPRQRNLASATLRGAGRDAAHLLPDLLRHLQRPAPVCCGRPLAQAG